MLPGSFPLAQEALERPSEACVAAGAAFLAGAAVDAVAASFGALVSILLFTCVFRGLATVFVAAGAVFRADLAVSTTTFAGLPAASAACCRHFQAT
jgi:hypothetical protein